MRALMNYWGKKSVTSATIALCVGLVGCGVKKDSVKNEPPVLEDNLAAGTSTQYGELRPKSITLFFWPEGLTEEQSRLAAYTVRSTSFQIDQIYTKKAGYGQLEQAFATAQCPQHWAAAIADQPGAHVPWVTAWKPLEVVPPAVQVPENDHGYPDFKKYTEYLAEKKSLETCMANQTARQKLFPWLAKQADADLQAANLKILQTIDPTFPKQLNWKTVNAEGSKIVFLANNPTHATSATNPVQITFKDFMTPGFSPSNVPPAGAPTLIFGASFIPMRKLLVFGIPELSSSGVPSGRVFKCALERAADFLGMARFSGEVDLTEGQKIVRTGSITITGPIL